MINRFKIWFNRNNYKIMMTVVALIVGYATIRGLNNYFKNFKEDSEKNATTTQSSIYKQLDGEYLFENKNDINTYTKVNSSEDEYGVVQNIIKNIFNKVAKANQSNNSEIKSELYDICLDNFLDDMTSYNKEPSEENILDYYPGVTVNNINKYYVGEIYRFYQNGDIKGYIVDMRYDLGNNNYEKNLIVIYADYKNKTFSYSGGHARLEGINCSIDVDSISANGGNTF